MDELKTAPKVVGEKQSRRAMSEGKALKAFIAADAEDKVRLPMIEFCGECGVAYEMVETMAALGEACGIEIRASVAVMLRN